jgi:hypothetical protein
MKNKPLLTLAMLSAVALTTVAPAFAQDKVQANIPFTFNMGSKSFPAGDYNLQWLGTNSLVITNAATSQSARALTMTAPPKQLPAEALLVFRQYGSTRFLCEIQTTDSQRTISVSKAEREFAAKTAEIAEKAPAREVYLAARAH